MTIKEVEQELGVPRATVRFYEKQNLLSPGRGENSYRDYNKDDVERLKTIIIFRKLGMSVADIKDIFDGSVSLSMTLEKNIAVLQKQVEELNGAIRVCKQMQANHEELENFDERFYWEEIHKEEEEGSRFLDIASDIIRVEKKIVFDQFGIADRDGNLMYGKREAFLRAFGLCIFCGLVFFVVYGIDSGWEWKNFIRGFFWPATVIFVYTLWELPMYFMAKKYPERAEKIRTRGKKIGTFFLAVLLIVCLILIICSD